MLFKRLTEEKKKEIMQKVMRREIKDLDEFIDAFQPLIWKRYYIESKKVYNLNQEDFSQQCRLIIIKCLKNFKGNVFGELCNYIVISLNNGVKDFVKKKINYDKYNVLGQEPDYVYNLKASYLEYSLEEEIVNKVTVVQNYDKFIKNRIPKKQEAVLIAFCSGEEAVKDYILKTGIKNESFRKCLNRAIISVTKMVKIGELQQLEG
ncbi:hypothetical protein [Clostridium aciditolerans]|uniref:Uncharacterized protein n=1 Tax=Clostridium aciditolerans TaxID=339861 RepID=A0A934HZI4_9CLOT|nr:hypothetical protein [Clostridium aciditolerans]MBI6873608.1 hypothetical protein [Clostridium aciditolerans]